MTRTRLSISLRTSRPSAPRLAPTCAIRCLSIVMTRLLQLHLASIRLHIYKTSSARTLLLPLLINSNVLRKRTTTREKASTVVVRVTRTLRTASDVVSLRVESRLTNRLTQLRETSSTDKLLRQHHLSCKTTSQATSCSCKRVQHLRSSANRSSQSWPYRASNFKPALLAQPTTSIMAPLPSNLIRSRIAR